MRENIRFVTDETTNVRTNAASICGNEPLPEPYESAARMVYGDRSVNEAFIAKRDLPVGSLQRWREHPEMIARVRYLARSHREQVQRRQQGLQALQGQTI